MLMAIVIDQHVPCALQPAGYPMGVVWEEQSLIDFAPVIVGARVAVAVKQISALVAIATGTGCRLRCGCAVVDHPGFAEVTGGDQNLIQRSIVIYGVKVRQMVRIL